MRTSVGQPVRLIDYRVADHLVDLVELDVSLDIHATRVVSTLSLRPNPAGQAEAALALDGDELVFVSAELDGAPLDGADFEASASQFLLPRPPQRPFKLKIETRLDPAANTKLMGLFRTGSAYCTQCEAEGFRRIAYFLDRPDVLSTYRVRLEADRAEAPVLLANGNLESAGDADIPGRHYAIWRDPHKKPCYLFALVAGDLGHIADSFVTASGRNVALAIYVEHGREERARYAMDALKRSMAWDERAYGREYDLDVFNIVAVSDFNMGAMENKGLNVFNDKYVLASPETATDDDYAGIEGVIAHEYFHNWTGNRVTCRDWFQLCLKEGLTVFRDQEFSADMRSAPVKRIADVRTLRAAQFPEDAGPLAHNVRPEIYHEISNFYTATVYQKGAEVIRMLKRLIGAQAFRAGMDLYFARYDGQAATVEDFIGCFATVSGRDLTRFMRWYSQAGTPKVTVRSAYDAAAKTYRLDIAQSLAPTPGESRQAADDDAAGARPGRPQRRRRAAGVAGRDRRGARERGHRAEGRRAVDCLSRRASEADPLVPARLQRAGAGGGRPHRGGPHRPLPARQRQLQPLAVAAEPCDAHLAARRQGHSGGPRARARREVSPPPSAR